MNLITKAKSIADPVSVFQSAMASAGILSDEIPIADGHLHRFKVDGDKIGSKNGWYILFNDGMPAGRFGHWRLNIDEIWCLKSKDVMTTAERQEWQKQMQEAKAIRKREQQLNHEEAETKAKDIWQTATTDPTNHPYIKTKQITPHSVRLRNAPQEINLQGEVIVVPVRDNGGDICSLQFIDGEGNKRFLPGGKVSGCYCVIGAIKDKLYICEGYATGATIHQATDKAVAVAFNTGNLKTVAEAMRRKYPDMDIVICADNDEWTEGNPGKTKATEAAQAINAKIAIPEFEDTTGKPTDFNDLYLLADHLTEGLETVKQQLESAAPIQDEDKKCDMASEMDELKSVILDHGLDLISRPIALIKEKGYIATWVDMKLGTEMIRDVLCVINQDGEVYTSEKAPGCDDIEDLNIPVDLPLIVESKKRLSGEGLKKYLEGERPDPVNVFERLRDYFDYFMDFDLSFSPQSQMSELSACYAISTYLTDAFPVIGYLWPNGETGSGKTHYLITMSEVAYLGQVILAGGTFSSLRDLASYGATLCFDDAEKIMDNKADPDKQALLLAGNRKGTMVTFKEQIKNKKWQLRNIHIYCPRLFSAIRLPSETLINRSIIIPLVASGDNRKSNSDPLDHESWPKDIAWGELIDDLWMMALANISTIPKHDRLATSMSQINGRAYQPWRAMHTIAHWLTELGAEGLYERMIKVTKDYSDEGDLIVPDPKIKLITETLRELYNEKGGEGTVTLASKEICSRLTLLAKANDLIDEDAKYYLSPRSLGWKLRHMRLKKPDKRSGKAREWIIDQVILQRLERPFNLINQTSQTSQNVKMSQNNDVSPENDVNDVNDVLSEGSTEGNAAQMEVTL